MEFNISVMFAITPDSCQNIVLAQQAVKSDVHTVTNT